MKDSCASQGGSYYAGFRFTETVFENFSGDRGGGGRGGQGPGVDGVAAGHRGGQPVGRVSGSVVGARLSRSIPV